MKTNYTINSSTNIGTLYVKGKNESFDCAKSMKLTQENRKAFKHIIKNVFIY